MSTGNNGCYGVSSKEKSEAQAAAKLVENGIDKEKKISETANNSASDSSPDALNIEDLFATALKSSEGISSDEAKKWFNGTLNEKERAEIENGISSIIHRGCMLAAKRSYETLLLQKRANKEAKRKKKDNSSKIKQTDRKRHEREREDFYTGPGQNYDYYGGDYPDYPPGPGFHDDPYYRGRFDDYHAPGGGAENLLIATIDTTILAQATIEDMMDTTVMMIIIIEVAEEKNGDKIDPEVEVMNPAVDRDEGIDTNIQIDTITAQGQDLKSQKIDSADSVLKEESKTDNDGKIVASKLEEKKSRRRSSERGASKDKLDRNGGDSRRHSSSEDRRRDRSRRHESRKRRDEDDRGRKKRRDSHRRRSPSSSEERRYSGRDEASSSSRRSRDRSRRKSDKRRHSDATEKKKSRRRRHSNDDKAQKKKSKARNRNPVTKVDKAQKREKQGS
eukprot:CAMPEP_0194236404 /NCGR_PEP_ID=MMETSP0158-20130606/3646_1 /TAXON_ID=33649 /ORGANISM="Thalassionema nitzschioides, Strain L26-B" /LENGTH=446 /DNA_ID=CAMNT_0038970139 /DNA_START=329 /DNA_END=1666 /DNA_ORIENTATION=-